MREEGENMKVFLKTKIKNCISNKLKVELKKKYSCFQTHLLSYFLFVRKICFEALATSNTHVSPHTWRLYRR